MTLNHLCQTFNVSPFLLMAACSLSFSVNLAGQMRRLPWETDSGDDSSFRRVAVYGDLSAGKSSLHGWTVDLISNSHVGEFRAAPRWNGSFEFHGVAPGEYWLRVRDARGLILHEETVSLYRSAETLSIQVRSEESDHQGEAQTVSLRELQHKVPRKAQKEFKAARASIEKKQLAQAVDHLKSALAIDPQFVEAHNDLGAAYFLQEDYQRSAEQFQKAIDLAPTHKQAGTNLCLALLKLRRIVEAGQAADRIVKRGGAAPTAHYAMAVGLLAGSGSRSDALFHLRLASTQIPNARLLTARVLADSGNRAEAAREVEAYLGSQNGASKFQGVEEWLAELRR